ncbi:MAG: DUF489 family protein [Pseudomonadales bacterium]
MPDSIAIEQWQPLQRRALCLVAVVAAAERVDANANGKPALYAAANDEPLDQPGGHPLERALLSAAADRSPADWQALFPAPALFAEPARLASAMLAGRHRNRQVPLYAFQLLALAERLDQQPAIRNALATQLNDCSSANASELAEIYQRTISKLGQRIQVSGDAQALQDSDRAAQIRALLLAGVRFAWLWRSLGGKRRHLVLGRRKLVSSIDSITGLLHD